MAAPSSLSACRSPSRNVQREWIEIVSDLLDEAEVFLGADPQRSEVALNFKHRQVFLGSDDDRPQEIGAIPYSMVPLLADEVTSDFFQEPLEFLVMDGAEGGHRLSERGDFDDLALLSNDAGRAPLILDLLPAIFLEDFLPSPLLSHFLNKQLQGRGEGSFRILKRVAVGNQIEGRRITEEYLAFLHVEDGDTRFDGRASNHRFHLRISILHRPHHFNGGADEKSSCGRGLV